MAGRKHEYRGEKSNATGRGCGKTERGHLSRDDDMVAHAKVLVTERLRFLGNRPQRVGLADDRARAT